MTEAELKTLVKQSLRVSTTTFDNEIENLIAQAEDDISKSCNHDFDITNPDECQMVVLYCKGLFGDGDEKSWNLYSKRLEVIGVRKQ
jgi:predicted transcriptional regulator YheO